VSKPRISFFEYVRSYAVWIYLLTVTGVAFLLVFLLWITTAWWLDPQKTGPMWVMRLWSRVSVWGNPLYRVSLEGTENIRRGETYVIASNHQSYGDIFVLGYLPLPYVYLSKAEIFRIPVVGWGMWIVGNISLKRGDKDSAKKAMVTAAERLSKSVCVLIFPEGTRSADGSIGPFKEGAFRLAVRAQRPLLPVVIEGSRDILSNGSFHFTRRAFVRIAVLPPALTAGKSDADVPELSARVREAIEAKVLELRAIPDPRDAP